MKLLWHIGGGKEHMRVEEDEATGIRQETHTPVLRGGGGGPCEFGAPEHCWYHPQEPREVTHASYEEALAAACEAGIIAATYITTQEG